MLDDRRARAARAAPRGRLLARHAPAPGHRRGAAAPAAAADPRRARDRPRPGGDARHAPADPPPRRRRDHGAALEPPAARGAGTVRPRRDRRLAAASSTRARSPTCAARAARATGCARPTTRRARASRSASRASSTPTRASTGSASRPRSAHVGALSLALGAGRHRHPLAHARAGDARGPVLPPHRARHGGSDAAGRRAEAPAAASSLVEAR